MLRFQNNMSVGSSVLSSKKELAFEHKQKL